MRAHNTTEIGTFFFYCLFFDPKSLVGGVDAYPQAHMTSRTLSYSPSPSLPEDTPADDKPEDAPPEGQPDNSSVNCETEVAPSINFGRCGSSEIDPAPAPSAPEERPAPLSPLASLQPPSRELRSHSRAMSSATPT